MYAAGFVLMLLLSAAVLHKLLRTLNSFAAFELSILHRVDLHMASIDVDANKSCEGHVLFRKTVLSNMW